MDYRIDDTHPDYIRMNIQGPVDRQAILDAMKDLVTHPDYNIKHSLWDFTRAEQGGIGLVDFKEIIGFLRLYKPREKTFANKSALVVSSQFQFALLNVFVAMAKMLPFKYRVFADIGTAQAYLEKADG